MHFFRLYFSTPALPLLAFVLVLLFQGCAAPGEPTARKQPVPEAVANLAASQSGNAALLTFTLPQNSVGGRPLEKPPAVQIYRNFEPSPASGSLHATERKHPTLLVTIPAELVPRYVTNQQFRYLVLLQAADFTRHPASIAVYSVRTRVSRKKFSANSNLAALRVYPAPEPIDDLKAQVTPTGVQLSWTPPQKTPVGPVPPLAGYRIYRGEGDLASLESAAIPTPSTAQLVPPGSPLPGRVPPPPPPLVKIGESKSPDFSDTRAEVGKTYFYSVRSLLDYSGTTVESADSNSFAITPRDTFPPAAPNGLIAIFTPAAGGVPAHVDLSWAVSPEADLAGYRVYRSEEAGALGTRLNKALLLTPAFRDMNVVSGRHYDYAVTAVDRSGNESAPSAAASVVVPAGPAQP